MKQVNKKVKKLKELKFVSRIEDMTDKELRERVKYGMDAEIKNKIRPVPYLGKKEVTVEYSYPELQGRCPMTRVKDMYKIRIKFIPNKFVPELKSLKFYFFGYEDFPISHEHLIAKIYKDFKFVLKPKKLAMELYVAARGELKTTVAIGDAELLSFGRPITEESFAE